MTTTTRYFNVEAGPVDVAGRAASCGHKHASLEEAVTCLRTVRRAYWDLPSIAVWPYEAGQRATFTRAELRKMLRLELATT